MEPSRSAGSNPPQVVESWKHCMAPGVPLAEIVLLRSWAQTLAPFQVLALANML